MGKIWANQYFVPIERAHAIVIRSGKRAFGIFCGRYSLSANGHNAAGGLAHTKHQIISDIQKGTERDFF